MTDDRLKALIALTSVALVGVIVAGALVGSRSAAHDLRPRAEAALTAAGLGEVDVRLTGREARVSDGSAVELARARTVVESVHGVRWARVAAATASRIDAAGPDKDPSAPTLELRRAGHGIEIGGTVPSADAAAEIKAVTAEAFGTTVMGDLTIDPAVGDVTWLRSFRQGLRALVRVTGLEVRIHDDGRLELEGRLPTRVETRRTTSRLERAFPRLRIRNHVVVAKGD